MIGSGRTCKRGCFCEVYKAEHVKEHVRPNIHNGYSAEYPSTYSTEYLLTPINTLSVLSFVTFTRLARVRRSSVNLIVNTAKSLNRE